MSVVLSILAGVLILCISVLVVAAAMPLRLELVLTKQDRWGYEVAWRAFGRFGPRVAMPIKSSKPKKAKPAKASKGGKRRSRWRSDPTQVVGAVVRLVTDILHCIQIETCRMDVTFGTGDPADTGHVYGLLMPVIYGPAASPRFWFNVEPDFQQAVFGGRAEFAISMIPASVLPPIARFGWSAFGPKR